MLASAGLPLANRPLDTYRLSSLFLYGLPAYGLGAIATALNIRADEFHRAMADAETARRVFLSIIPLMQRYSSTTLLHAARYAAAAGWQESWLIRLLAEDETLSPLFRNAADLPWLEPAETRFLNRL